jgi:uncharacterized protein (TIGR03790 family)
MFRGLLLSGLALWAFGVQAEGLTPERLGVIYNRDDPASVRAATYYESRRRIPAQNVVGISLAAQAVIGRDQLSTLRKLLLARLPAEVQSLLLVWSKPYAVECMSITMAVAAGYQPGFCEPGCAATTPSALYDTEGWLPADTVGWLPAMLLPSEDEAMARAVIDRGIQSDGSAPAGTVYLVRTQDPARNVRAMEYPEAQALLSGRMSVRILTVPIKRPPSDILAYFTGATHVDELASLGFHPGAVADHLTSTGGVLQGGSQMSALAWLKQGATGSFGTVSEPCNRTTKFPNPAVFVNHYLRGETLLEAYWKSVQMPGQGLFIGEPLSRPYGASRQAGF